MTGITEVNYGDALQGRIRRSPSHDPDPWLATRGAKYMGSNEFVDPSLTLTTNHFENVISIIHSARSQGHEGVEVRLTPDSLKAVDRRIAELSATENVDIDACLYGEHIGKEKIIMTFRERTGTWLLETAAKTLTTSEFLELSELLLARLKRTDREIELTRKALAQGHAIE